MHWLGFHWLLPHPWLIRSPPLVQPIVRPLLPRRVRGDARRRGPRRSPRLPRETEPPCGVAERGTVALLAGLRPGPVVPPGEPRDDPRPRPRGLARHGAQGPGVLRRARRAQRTARRRAAAGRPRAPRVRRTPTPSSSTRRAAAAHMRSYEDLQPGTELPVRRPDGVPARARDSATPSSRPVPATVAYHDACHALRAQGIHASRGRCSAGSRGLDGRRDRQRRPLLRRRRDLRATQPELAGALGQREGGRRSRRPARRSSRRRTPAAPCSSPQHLRANGNIDVVAPGRAARSGAQRVANQ